MVSVENTAWGEGKKSKSKKMGKQTSLRKSNFYESTKWRGDKSKKNLTVAPYLQFPSWKRTTVSHDLQILNVEQSHHSLTLLTMKGPVGRNIVTYHQTIGNEQNHFYILCFPFTWQIYVIYLTFMFFRYDAFSGSDFYLQFIRTWYPPVPEALNISLVHLICWHICTHTWILF